MLATLIAGVANAEMSRPMAEMQGDCDHFKMPLATEMSLWEGPELRVQGAQDDKSTAVLPVGRPIHLKLYPSKTVTMTTKPEKDFTTKGQASFAGLAAFEVPKDGVYRISLGSKIWLDVVDAGRDGNPPKSVSSETFEMQTQCKKIFKAVEYKLKRGQRYFLQFSSSLNPEAKTLITAAP